MENNNVVYDLNVGDCFIFEEHFYTYLNYVLSVSNVSDNSILVKMISFKDGCNCFSSTYRTAFKCNYAFIFDYDVEIKKISKEEFLKRVFGEIL